MENELLIYEAFPYDQQQPQNNLKVRFKKVQDREDENKARQISFKSILTIVLFPKQVHNNINFREKKSKPRRDKKAEGGPEEAPPVKSRIARFRYFEDISGYSGV